MTNDTSATDPTTQTGAPESDAADTGATDTGAAEPGVTETAAAPVISVTRGNPNAEEVAAVTVLLAALGSGAVSTEPNLRRGWARPSRRFGGGVSPAIGWGRR